MKTLRRQPRDKSGGSMYLFDDDLQIYFNCGDELHDGTYIV